MPSNVSATTPVWEAISSTIGSLAFMAANPESRIAEHLFVSQEDGRLTSDRMRADTKAWKIPQGRRGPK